MNLTSLRVLTCSFIICMAFFSSLPLLGQNCPAPYVERNGFVVIEAEAADNIPSAWNRRTNIGGYTGSSYLRYEGTDNFNRPGRNVYSFKFYVASAGTFRFQWRNRIARGSNNTEHNDSWLRFPDAADFFGRKGSSVVYPKGSGKFPTAEGSGGNGWFKIYTNNLNRWTYETVTSDFDPHDIFVRFNSAGVYTVQVAGRSNGHAVDRLVLYRQNRNTSEATNPSLSVTRCVGDSPNQSPVVQAGSDKTIQLPDNDITLTANANDPDGSISSYSWSKVSGPSANLSGTGSKSLQVNNMVEGTYEFKVTVTDNDGAKDSDNVKVTVKPEDQPDQPVEEGSITLTLYNANTDKPISGFDPIRNGAVVDLSQTGRSLTIVANTTGRAGSVVFNYNGRSGFRVEGSEPFSLGGDIGVDLQPWNYELGNNNLEAIARNSSGVLASTSVQFSIVDGTPDPEPPVSDGVTLSLINTNSSDPVSGFDPISNGDIIDISRVGNDLSIVANVSAEADRVFFTYNGVQNYKKEYLTPYAIAGDNGPNDIQSWNYELGDNEITATVYNSSGNIIARNTVSFTIAEDVVNPEPPVVPGEVTLTLYNAVTDTPINGFDPMSDGQTIDLSQTGKSLAIVANATGDADLIKFNLNGRIVRYEGLAPYSIAGDIGDDLLPYTFPLGGNLLTVIVEDNSGTVIAEETISFNVVEGSNARFASQFKTNQATLNNRVGSSLDTNSKVSIYPNPAQRYINITLVESAEITLYSNTGRVVKSLQLPGGNAKINVSDLKPGIYNLQIQELGVLNSLRFIKR